MAKEHSSKELAILEAAIHLLRKGIHPYEIKVSDIALQAKVGKGTIYEYFDTKEEVIGQSVLYNMEKDRGALLEELAQTKGFFPRIDRIMDRIRDSVFDPLSPFHLMMAAKDFTGILQKCVPGKEPFQREMDHFHEILDCIIREGRKEGMIREKDSQDYLRLVLKSALFAWGHSLLSASPSRKESMNLEKNQIQDMIKRAYK